MILLLVHIVAIIAALGAILSLAYYTLCLYSAVQFLRQSQPQGSAPREPQSLPPVSILKPLKGTDPQMYEGLRSHCLQDYPDYEIVFGVSEASDPAVPVVNRLQTDFPRLPIRLVVCDKRLGANTKVSNLAQMVAVARHDVLLVNDSDIRVEPTYLAAVVLPLAEPDVGMVTCVYRGVPAPSLGSRLEATGINTDFCAGVLVAKQLEGVRFGLGSTLVFRRQDLEGIGGFQSLADYLADDYELGRRIAASGLQVDLSNEVVETCLPQYTFRAFLQHQLRWARTVRDARRGGYLGLAVTFGIPWSLLALLASRGALWSWALLAAVILLRGAVAITVGGRVLKDKRTWSSLWLIPFRDLVALAIWIASFVGHTVSWRGELFILKDGRLARTGAP
jgi:ceramide glucosyltransferase